MGICSALFVGKELQSSVHVVRSPAICRIPDNDIAVDVIYVCVLAELGTSPLSWLWFYKHVYSVRVVVDGGVFVGQGVADYILLTKHPFGITEGREYSDMLTIRDPMCVLDAVEECNAFFGSHVLSDVANDATCGALRALLRDIYEPFLEVVVGGGA